MMQMLEAGGVPVVSDGIRAADADNPRGYQEIERVKKLAEDSSWLAEMQGKAIKVVSMLLYELPPQFTYKTIFMERPFEEMLASQREMLRRRGVEIPGPDDATMQRHFESHLLKVRQWLASRSNFTVLDCQYRDLMGNDAACIRTVAEFLELPLDLGAMATAIDPQLYRNRAKPPTLP